MVGIICSVMLLTAEQILAATPAHLRHKPVSEGRAAAAATAHMSRDMPRPAFSPAPQSKKERKVEFNLTDSQLKKNPAPTCSKSKKTHARVPTSAKLYEEETFFEFAMGMSLKQAQDKGFTKVGNRVNVLGDGNCMFHAIHAVELIYQHLYGIPLTANSAQELRIKIAEHALDMDQAKLGRIMEKYGIRFEQWLEEMFAVEAPELAWGGSECMAIYCDLTKRRGSITSFHPNYANNQYQPFHGDIAFPVNLFLNLNHFMAEIPVELRLEQ